MNNHKWQIGPVGLADGSEGYIDAINERQEEWMYTGRVRSGGLLIATGWDASGRYMYAPLGSPYNLAPPPKKTVRAKCWLVVYKGGCMCIFDSLRDALIDARKHGFALIEIDREVEEGEGL